MTRTIPPNGCRRPVHATALVALLAALSGCGFEPSAPLDRQYSMSRANRAKLERTWGEDIARGAEAQVLGALEMLVGTPAAPRFLITEAMVDGGWDPNIPSNPDVGELSEATWEEIVADNRNRRFEDQIRLIQAGRYEAVPEPAYAVDLWKTWEEEFLPALLEDPDAPRYPDDPEFGTWKERAVALFAEHYPTLRESSEMYRVQCLHCHGTNGGGQGPTGEYLNPVPRDYRHGKFKWVKVDRNRRPRRADLLEILEYGVPRTAMPSFDRFSRGQLEGLVDYVRLLAIRGEVETFMVSDVVNSDYGDLPAGSVLSNYEIVWRNWRNASEAYTHYEGEVPRPDEITPERIARGKELFHGEVSQCATCHGDLGRGDGESSYEEIDIVDEDGETVTVRRKALNEWGEFLETALGGKGALMGAEAKSYASDPRNLQLGNYRGGGRPIDLYRRVKYGISGTIMPAASTELTDEDIWDLVYYVRSIGAEHDPARIQEHRVAQAGDGGHGEGSDDDHGSPEGH